MDELSNEELFNSALSDLPEPEVEKQPELDTTEGDTRARDDQGRFVAKTDEPEPKAEPKTEDKPVEAKEDAPIPSWRLREIREERDALRARLAAMQSQQQAPKPEPQAKPDIFEKPDDFVRANVQEALTPLQTQFSTFVETVSRRDAVREHGQERVTEAFTALDQAAKSGDPQALAVVNQVKQSMDPFGDIVSWYRSAEASRNPQGFFQRQLEEALKDEKFKGELMAKLQPAPAEKPKPVFNVPPSLNRAAAAAPSFDEGGDLSNESLFANALR